MIMKESFVRAVAEDIDQYLKDNHGVDVDFCDLMEIINCQVRYLGEVEEAHDAFFASFNDDEEF